MVLCNRQVQKSSGTLCYTITKEKESHGDFPLFFIGLTEVIELAG